MSKVCLLLAFCGQVAGKSSDSEGDATKNQSVFEAILYEPMNSVHLVKLYIFPRQLAAWLGGFGC